MRREDLDGSYWYGKPILDMSREELLDMIAVILTAQAEDRNRHRHQLEILGGHNA